MIRIAQLRGGRYSNHAQVAYESAFKAKFDLVADIPNFEVLENFAQQCIDLHCGDSLDGITARVYMDKIIAMTDDEFIRWATSYATKSRTKGEG